jgi:hypothetical protein
MTKNLLVGLSTQNRSGKYLYYGAYDTDNLHSLVAGELGVFWASKSNGPDADTGAYTGGGSNDDLTSSTGNVLDIGDTPTLVAGIDKFFFAVGAGTNKVRLGSVINANNMTFKVAEYVAPVKKVQTITIAAASLVATKVISFSLYSKDAPVGAVGTLKEMNIDYTIPTGGTATTIGAAIKALMDAHGFTAKYLYSVSEAHSSDVVITVTWAVGKNGTIVNNSVATATSVIATSTALTTGNGTSAQFVTLEKECKVLGGYNENEVRGWTEADQIVDSTNYHQITIQWNNNTSDALGLNPPVGVKQTQYLLVDTSDTDMTLLEEIVGLLSDMVAKRALNGAA